MWDRPLHYWKGRRYENRVNVGEKEVEEIRDHNDVCGNALPLREASKIVCFLPGRSMFMRGEAALMT